MRYVFPPSPPSPHDYNVWNALVAPVLAGGEHSRYLLDVAGDGNCYFRSLATMIYATEEAHAVVRAELLAHLR